jgi:hypothetical protein
VLEWLEWFESPWGCQKPQPGAHLSGAVNRRSVDAVPADRPESSSAHTVRVRLGDCACAGRVKLSTRLLSALPVSSTAEAQVALQTTRWSVQQLYRCVVTVSPCQLAIRRQERRF